jgi:hypothetical protein
MKHFADWDERTLDLCIDRFTVGLDRDGEDTLDRLADPTDVEDFERAVAAVHLGLLGDIEAPPSTLMERLQHDALHNVSSSGAAETPRGQVIPFRTRAVAALGWLVAAALLLVLFPFGPFAPGEPDVFTLRETLVADATDLVRASWTATEDAAALEASGEVVWSSDRQEGYMLFRGLEPNDPTENQYQLWIFDPTRADWEAKPVDGGVFDVPSTGEVVVPIEAKLGVSETALFAVTVEVPGGVVVSERERIVLTASP